MSTRAAVGRRVPERQGRHARRQRPKWRVVYAFQYRVIDADATSHDVSDVQIIPRGGLDTCISLSVCTVLI